MKGFVFGAATAVAVTFAFAGVASAGDLVAKCKANAEAEGDDVAAAEGLCGCLVEQSNGDEALLDEFMIFAELPSEERGDKFDAEGSEAAKAVMEACSPEEEAAE